MQCYKTSPATQKSRYEISMYVCVYVKLYIQNHTRTQTHTSPRACRVWEFTLPPTARFASDCCFTRADGKHRIPESETKAASLTASITQSFMFASSPTPSKPRDARTCSGLRYSKGTPSLGDLLLLQQVRTSLLSVPGVVKSLLSRLLTAITTLGWLRWSVAGIVHSWNTQQEHAGPHGGRLSTRSSFIADVQASPSSHSWLQDSCFVSIHRL